MLNFKTTILLFLLSNAFATEKLSQETENDNCKYAPGHWEGTGQIVFSDCVCTAKSSKWDVEDFNGDGSTLVIIR